MKAKKKYQAVRVAVATDVNSCASKHSKAGAGCKTAKIVPCRIGQETPISRMWGGTKLFLPIILIETVFTKMKKLTEKIYKELLSRNSVLLIGREDSGKTYYALNELTPFLNNKKLNTVYFPNCEDLLSVPDNTDVVIIDEVETLVDKDFLERQHPHDKPYYPTEYLEKIKIWHNKLKIIQIPAVFILTRNKKEEIEYLIDNVKTTDWGTPVECLIFENYKNSS